ncbi:MAG TPA: hypothetical protein VIE66_10165 [Methylocella sp.]
MTENTFESFSAASKSDVEQHFNVSRDFVNEMVKVFFNHGLSTDDMNALFPAGPFDSPNWDIAKNLKEPLPEFVEAVARHAVMTRQAEEELLFRSRPN